MQNLTKLINEAKKQPHVTEQNLLNIMREYLQVLILKAIYQSRYGRSLSFIGGTALRICYDLKRYSEDLDFTLDKAPEGYSFKELNEIVASFLKNTDFQVELNVAEDKTVQKSFIKVSNILHFFGLSPLESQKLHVKLEVDARPVKVSNQEIETFFVNRFDELFPIIKHTDATMFAGKIMAILHRPYIKGRDYYDLIWYLRKKTAINFSYLNRGLRQFGSATSFSVAEEVFATLGKKVETLEGEEIIKDVGRFLQDQSEVVWLKNYLQVFRQLTAAYDDARPEKDDK